MIFLHGGASERLGDLHLHGQQRPDQHNSLAVSSLGPPEIMVVLLPKSLSASASVDASAVTHFRRP